MTPEQQLNTILLSLGGWSTLTTVGIILARRDFVLGLKKWFYLKMRKQPLKIRYHGPDKNVIVKVIPMKGKGETFTLFDKKLLFVKTGEGMTFLVDEAALRRGDDGVYELSYSYRSIMPIDPNKTREEIAAETEEFLRRVKSKEERKQEEKEGQAHQPIEADHLIPTTDPKRLNKLIDYVYLAAKADALAAATDVEKYVKWTLFGVGAVIILSILIYYTMDAKIIPMVQNLGPQIQALAGSITGVVNLG